MEKKAIVAFGHEGVNINDFCQSVWQPPYETVLLRKSPFFDTMVAENGNVIIILTGKNLSYVPEVLRELSEKGYDISGSILVCSYIEGVINSLNRSLDTLSEEKEGKKDEVFTSFTNLIELLEALNLEAFSSLNILNSSMESYDPKKDIGKVLEYCNLSFNAANKEKVTPRLVQSVERYLELSELIPDEEIRILQRDVNVLVDYASQKAISLN